ncbi:isoprenyl transferase 1-like isoform X2 [Planococcus citri]|uniref:isoprenyl transferase 1-like isoform X2 n=1 Tax=Planococcus citri TaxID=170843 RepID=UPI0031F9A9F6
MFSIGEFFLHVLTRILRSGRIPQHIAFVPDNNRTFAKKTNADLLSTYIKGQRVLSKLLKWCVILKTSCVTIYLLSTHNLKRNNYEKQCIFDAINIFLHKLLIQPMNCRIKIVGDVSVLPHELKELCTLLSSQTKDNNGILVNVALNYSGKEELIDVSCKIFQKFYQFELKLNDMDENLFSDLVHTRPFSDVDLMIRTTVGKRLSEFLLWQNASSFLHFIDICWPEITEWHLLRAVFYYQCHK